MKFLPGNNALIGSANSVAVTFSEPIDEATLSTTSFKLIGAGADGIFGTADDVVPSGGTLNYRSTTNTAFLNFTQNVPGGLYRITINAPLADLAGNVIATPAISTFHAFSFVDSDGDGIPDDVEVLLGLDPHNPDTGGTGVRDGDRDYDHDGLTNAQEIAMGLDPRNPHSNGNPNVLDGDADADGDGLSNKMEFAIGTNPLNPDTDGDGWTDGAEVDAGTDPLNPGSKPGNSYVIARPDVSLLRLQGTGASSGQTYATPDVGIVRLNNSQAGAGGSVLATPDVTLLRLQGAGSTGGGLTFATPDVTILRLQSSGAAGGVTLASPDVSLVRFDNLQAGMHGTTLAWPDVSLFLPRAATGPGQTTSTTLSYPPVTIKRNP